jgi:hypothetical protein
VRASPLTFLSGGKLSASLACSSELCRKSRETAQLDSISATQSFYNYVQYRIDDLLYVALIEMSILRKNALYQVGF